MFLKSLKISSGDKIIREIPFRKGMNLIVDETPTSDDTDTGNNVGKTTVLKLIDFCLGADQKIIYVDPETKKDVYRLVKDYLIEGKVLITLLLKEDLDNDDSAEVLIERNFLPYQKKIRKINKNQLTEEEFGIRLKNLLIPGHSNQKPSFRQIIAHNIRYKDESINNTLKNVDKFTSDAEYETLYLFLFGCEFSRGNTKLEILEKIRQENTYINRLEKDQTKTTYETALALIDSEIKTLNKKKSDLNLNTDFENDLENLNKVKYDINKVSSEINKFKIRKDIIIEAEQEMNSRKSKIDLEQLELIYKQATDKIGNIQKTFNDLVENHNIMIVEKVKFIKKELPDLENSIKENKIKLNSLLKEEENFSQKITKSDSFGELESLIIELNEKFRIKGKYENIVKQIEQVEGNLEDLKKKLEEIDKEIFSTDFENVVKEQLYKFNQHFSAISKQLYNEQYAIKHDIDTNKKGQRLYKFSAFNTNLSSGKKQGEISCFDLAYTVFADEENIPCLHFLLNDKKELMHNNQLVKILEFTKSNDVQFIASILKDRLPRELNKEEYFAIKLSQQKKLFRIENQELE